MIVAIMTTETADNLQEHIVEGKFVRNRPGENWRLIGTCSQLNEDSVQAV